MHSEGGAVMFGREEPVDSSGKSLLLLRGRWDRRSAHFLSRLHAQR